VKQLCRYCCCPAEQTDNPKFDSDKKNQATIQELTWNSNVAVLKSMSQQFLDNAFYSIRFGFHNRSGIHGACPTGILHGLLIGIFKYVVLLFLSQLGTKSKARSDFLALAALYGTLLHRQSDRDKPKTQFESGIDAGKHMAKEYPGIILVILTVLRSTSGRQIVLSRNEFTEEDVKQWVELLETLLMWHAWLASDNISKSDALKAENKHRYIMYLIRRTAPRDDNGMGWKIFKYHAITHYSTDIINFGVPSIYDTESEESHHKGSKQAAELTQKIKHTFDKQISARLRETHVLDLAMEEMTTGRAPFDYLSKETSSVVQTNPPYERRNVLWGQRFTLSLDTSSRPILVSSGRKKLKDKAVVIELSFLHFLDDLNDKLAPYSGCPLSIRTAYTDVSGTIYRASPSFRDLPWQDWVKVDWGEKYGPLPCHIWGFVDLSFLPQVNDTSFEPGFHAIVESWRQLPSSSRGGHRSTELYTNIEKEVRGLQRKDGIDYVAGRQYYLVDVQSFVEPIIVVPDRGGPPNSFLWLERRRYWRGDFSAWLNTEDEEWNHHT